MIRKAFVMSVSPGGEEEYKRRHRPIWPELEQMVVGTPASLQTCL
jgi:L-rhamnose mutarotase